MRDLEGLVLGRLRDLWLDISHTTQTPLAPSWFSWENERSQGSLEVFGRVNRSVERPCAWSTHIECVRSLVERSQGLLRIMQRCAVAKYFLSR